MGLLCIKASQPTTRLGSMQMRAPLSMWSTTGLSSQAAEVASMGRKMPPLLGRNPLAKLREKVEIALRAPFGSQIYRAGHLTRPISAVCPTIRATEVRHLPQAEVGRPS